MKYSLSKFLLSLLMSMFGASAFAYDIAVENADGVTIYYNYINETYSNKTNRERKHYKI